MSPTRSYTNWNIRSTNATAQIEPYRHYYFICEGRNTEKWYFEKLIDIRKELSIHADIELVYLEKTGKDENLSNPTQLIEFAGKQKTNGSISFDSKFDKMVVVFDADVFENIYTNYDDVIKKGSVNNILGITNPSFELFLLLHYQDSVDDLIIPNQANIIANAWVGKGQSRKRYIEDLFRKKSGMRPKSNRSIGELAYDVQIAIEQEEKLNEDITVCKGKITSNIGKVIKSIMDDECR